MRVPEARILVFAKPPIPGRSKTRLIPALGKQGAAQLHAELVEHTLITATRAQLCPVELWCAGPLEHPFFDTCAQQFCIDLKSQTGTDLGVRMAHAMEVSLQKAGPVLLIGSDCPALTPGDLEAALDALGAGHECVLKPTEDGGYVLIGMTSSNAAVFTGVDWGSDRVMAQTRARLRSLGWHWQELATTWDLDRPEDLPRLRGSRFQAACEYK